MRPVAIDDFPGLDLRNDPGENPGAIDMMNVTPEPGRVHTREGSSLFFTTATKPIHLAEYAPLAGANQLIVCGTGAPGTVNVLNSSGASVATTTMRGSDAGASSVMLGTPAANYLYIAETAAGVVKKWDGTTWTTPGIPPGAVGAVVVTISPTDNRLVLVTANLHKVWFSDPGAPDTIGVNNFVQLTPGDGEGISAAAVFNNQTFLFKQSKFFIFYGNSTDATGLPIFNYRTVGTGVGTYANGFAGACCASPAGVYFISDTGIYRTTGGPPVCISAAIEPFFTGRNQSAYWQGGTFDPTQAGSNLKWIGGRLYASLFTGASTGVIMVYDERLDAWSVWSRRTFALASFLSSSAAGAQHTLFMGDTGTSVLKTDPSLATDAGTAIVSRYRMAFNSFGYRARRMFVGLGEKTLRETILEGTGSPTVQWSRDWGAPVTGSAVQLGTAPAVATGRQRLAIRGRQYSLQLGASSGAWAVNRVQANLRDAVRAEEITV